MSSGNNKLDEMGIDDVLEILSNSYRREILRLLTLKDRYAFELSKMLDISQRAVKNHLIFLQNLGLVVSDKRKSTKGPEREYFKLNHAVIVSLTVAPNLFLSTVRPLKENPSSQSQITPSLQLDVPKGAEFSEVIREGLNLLPQIQEGLDLLQLQQNKLLRGYQGIRAHLSEFLTKEGLSAKEIRIILNIIENEGRLTNDQLEFILGDLSSINKEIENLKRKGIIRTEIDESADKFVMYFILILQD